MTPIAAAARGAVRDARLAWGRAQTVLAAVTAAALLLPLAVHDELTLTSLAFWAYLALAAVGLTFVVGLAGMPSLAQGALLAVGAVVAAVLRADGDWPPLAAAAAGAVAAAVAGGVVGAAVGRLRPAFVAVATWLVAWLVARGLAEFPAFAGGAEGRIVPPGSVAGVDLGATLHWELAVVLVALGALGLAGVARGQPGFGLAGLRERPAAALALGVPALRLRTAAFAAAGLYAGLAGALAVQLEGIADPAAYSPVLSFTLFAAVLLGGARSATGAVAGTAAVGGLFWAADRLASSAGIATGRLDTLFAAALLLGALAIRSETVLPQLFRRGERLPEARPAASPRPARLEARGLEKAFAGEPALTAFDLVVEPGAITALVGPNGSGKTTALRLLAGTLAPDAGEVLLDGSPLPRGSQRTRALGGIVRTLQATQVFPGLTVLDNARIGAGLHVPSTGLARSLVATPKARAASTVARGTALAALREVGLDGHAERAAGHLTATDQRLLMLAAALAASPRVLLVDEPSAGASAEDVARIAGVLARIRDRGIAVLVVEHNLGLVGRVAETVVVLDAGRTIAAGAPAEIGDDPAVRAVYLGAHVISPKMPD
jgi:branched-chain amino acid transport system permease protein